MRTFRNSTAAQIHLCLQTVLKGGWQTGGPYMASPLTSPECVAFYEALWASDAICSIVCDWPAESMLRCCPFIAGALSAAACLQVIVKYFIGADSSAREKASISLTILTTAMKHFARFSGFCQHLLGALQSRRPRPLFLTNFNLINIDSLVKYEKKLSDFDCTGGMEDARDHGIRTQVNYFPAYIDAIFLVGLGHF